MIQRTTGSTRNDTHFPSTTLFRSDFFKNVNDTHGHQVGDDVLREIAHRVTHNVRSFDTVARLGGEEFVVVMPDTDLTVASAVAERLRGYIADKSFPTSDAPDDLAITISIGVASSLGRSEEHTSELQSLMRISYAVFCLKKKITTPHQHTLT